MRWEQAGPGGTILSVKPARRHYTKGWEIFSDDADGRWRYEWDGERGILSLWVDPDTRHHRIDILPKDQEPGDPGNHRNADTASGACPNVTA